MHLPPLSSGAVAEIAAALVGDEEGSALGQYLLTESEGNPFILVEVVTSLQEQGTLVTRGNRWHWTGPTIQRPLPIGVQDVILQRVGRLSEPAQRLLTLAAVIGRRFDTPILRAVTGRDMGAVESSLREWLKRRLWSALRTPTLPSQHRKDLPPNPCWNWGAQAKQPQVRYGI